MSVGASVVRRTLRAPAAFDGIGLFTAGAGRVRIVPGEPGTGIRFARVDVDPSRLIPALVTHVFVDPRLPGRNTSIIADASRAPGQDNPAIATVEHVMSALAGLRVTDVVVEVEGPEVPIVDGSAGPIVEAILGAGLCDVGVASPARVLDRTIVVGEAPGPTITLEPSARTEFEYRLDYGGDSLPEQRASFVMDAPGSVEEYAREIAPARTFCLMREAEMLRRAGLFGHVTTRQMLVVGKDGRPLENEWRMEHEAARHKLLDLMGDLALSGVEVRCRVRSDRGGHALNARAAGELRKWAEEGTRH
ncbi:MAG: UDP-3-O-acyl-N-acetylglucosamine deacetylase [Phycisphaerales bacterium]|nr:UDP-3-O-acyl-N-acetylglucosamine deacetylase [Phycisphaerales bacterium]